MSKVKERIRKKEKYIRERKMWLVFSSIIFRLPCSFLLGVFIGLVELDSFGTSRTGFESNLATTKSKGKEKKRKGRKT